MLSSTQQFIDTLEAKGIKYEINEPTQSGKDVMTVTYSGDSMPTIPRLLIRKHEQVQ